MYIVVSYFVYLAVSVDLGGANALSETGRSSLVDAFMATAELADSVNRLLVVGFYLINVGYVTRACARRAVVTVREAIQLVSDEFGLVLVRPFAPVGSHALADG